MMRPVTVFLIIVCMVSSALAQPSLLKFFEGEWEGTVKDFDAKGKETQKFKVRRSLKFVGSDTLKGTYQVFGENIESRPVPLEIIETNKGFVLKQAGTVFSGTYQDRTFTFQGKDESQAEIRQMHFFIGGDQEFFTLEQIDPQSKKKTVLKRGVLKLKKAED